MSQIRFFAAFAVALALVLPAAAQATPPTLNTVTQDQGYITAAWTLPEGMTNWQFEVAKAGDTGPGGAFLQTNVVYSSLLSTAPRVTGWTVAQRVVPGTYFVHVSAYGNCTSPLTPDCVKEFSNVKPITVPEPNPPSIDPVTVNAQHRASVTWNPNRLVNDFIEVATDPDVYPAGDEARGEFLLENTVLVDNLSLTAGHYTTPPLMGGTYYVHVVTHDPLRCPSPDSPDCVLFFSQTRQLSVPSQPFTLTAAQSGGRLSADWTISGFASDFLEIANSPAVYESGVIRGAFREENVIADAELDGQQRHYEHPALLPPGTYYVHVAAYYPFSCPINLDVLCLDEYSPTVAVTVPGPPPAKTAAAPPADKVASLAMLFAQGKQRIGSLVVLAAMGEEGTITVGGTVSVPNLAKLYRFKTVVRGARANVPTQFSLRLPKKARKAVRKALKKHRKLKAKLTIKAEDKAGNVTFQQRSVKLAL